MNREKTTADSWQEFEQGPIRPPSEAHSLLLRVTRNCPWNRCTFCPVYKEAKFSLRSVDDVKRDIDSIHRHVDKLRRLAGDRCGAGLQPVSKLASIIGKVAPGDAQAFIAAWGWADGDMKCVFLQDADTLVAKPHDLVEILTYLRKRFPAVERVTAYSRSQTIARKKDADLRAIRAAGLDRLHVGLESGCDRVLEMVRKGCTKDVHIKAGLKARTAGFELSEYIMPGLGGRELSESHALETADALNRIDPQFIRIRTLAIPERVPLHEQWAEGRFHKCTDIMVARELLMLVEHLDGITSAVRSDHILNLLGDLEGDLPGDKQRMIGVLRGFLEMEPERQRLYQVGRRLGILSGTGDMADPLKMAWVELSCRRLGVTPENVDEIADKIVTRYI